jgi:hypothetical protein
MCGTGIEKEVEICAKMFKAKASSRKSINKVYSWRCSIFYFPLS